jgi:hypothetical protein
VAKDVLPLGARSHAKGQKLKSENHRDSVCKVTTYFLICKISEQKNSRLSVGLDLQSSPSEYKHL